MGLSRKSYGKGIEEISKVSLDNSLKSGETEGHIEIREVPIFCEGSMSEVVYNSNSLQIYRTIFRLAGYEIVNSDFDDGSNNSGTNRLYLHVRRLQPKE